MKKRVYTLYRVSTKGQVEKDDIPMQKEACRNFAESQGWEIVKEFSEKGVSGFKKSAKDRDELQKIQQAAMEGKFDILLVFMFDRLGRRDDETPFIVEWFTKQGIEVWSVNEGQQRFDTHVDKLMNYIRYWQASGESLKTSVRTRTRLEQLTGEGHYTGGTVAFGYKRVRLGRVNKKSQEVCDLVIDEAEAEIVRLIFHKYVYEGYGAQKLSHYLYEQGVVGRNNKNIPNTSIVRMIKNKGYTGYLINGAVETECPQLRIIEPELFEQAQELRQARTCERGGTSLGTSSKALLTGLVYCAHCGNRLSLTSSGRTHTYADGHTVKEVRPRYSCFYKIRHPGDCDGQSGYGVSKLDSIVEEVVRQIFAQFREVSRKKLLESVKTNDAARIQKKIKKIQKDLEAKQKELDDLKAETILVIRGVSALDKELLGTLVAEAKDALETLEKQLVQAQEEYEEATKTAKRSNYICNELITWADVYDTANHDERRAILQQFIKEIRVRKDYEISITLNASFNQVEQLKAVSTYDGAEIFEEISEKGA
ncbi:recombinase family protein [Faecalibacterium prausnitzii]|uniref:recombinase family protein n=1 Tax=Faecalibacterium prausnitzii TaxID=853 RepID=UPI0029083EBB|nr:recombinase family protein [Faecalibacterium prausnitzii]MDU8670293.1 recombinase family protein [Faecalibacterium prausnitzii]